MPAKIYIAAPWNQKAQANDIGDKLEYIGFAITSDWHKPGIFYPVQIAAAKDLEAIDICEILLLLDIEPSQGKHFETGYAYHQGKQVFWWHWDPSSFPVFMHLPKICNIYSWDELVERLSQCQL